MFSTHLPGLALPDGLMTAAPSILMGALLAAYIRIVTGMRFFS